MSKNKLCGMASRTLGLCELPREHTGDMHVSQGDGFYVNCEAPTGPEGQWHCGKPACIVLSNGDRRCALHLDGDLSKWAKVLAPAAYTIARREMTAEEAARIALRAR